MPGPSRTERIPLGVKLGWTAFVVLWAPLYAVHHGWSNFLWFCDLANFLIAVALWLESPLLLSAQAVTVLVVQVAWAFDWLGRLVAGAHPLGGTEYMFDPAKPVWLRALSLFHLAVPPLLLWGLARLGYDRRGLAAATAITWVVLPVSFLVTTVEQNLNWLHAPFGVPQTLVPPPVWLAVTLVAYPLVVFLPTHLLLRRWASSGEVTAATPRP